MRARSAGVSLAVPMSIPLYTCIESAEITSPPTFSARLSVSAVLPTAVGPTMAIIRVFMLHLTRTRVKEPKKLFCRVLYFHRAAMRTRHSPICCMEPVQ